MAEKRPEVFGDNQMTFTKLTTAFPAVYQILQRNVNDIKPKVNR